jgi:Zn-finger nucleic acid-binding protein
MEISAKGLYTCGHCGTTSIPERRDRDGVHVLGPGDGRRKCPACRSPLVRAMLDEYQINYCEKCRGLLVPRRSFAEIVRRRRAWAEGPPVTPIPPDGNEMRRKIPCPKCAALMTTDWYYGPGNIILDRCDACDLVWLDYGELKQVVDAPGVDRGSRDLS